MLLLITLYQNKLLLAGSNFCDSLFIPSTLICSDIQRPQTNSKTLPVMFEVSDFFVKHVWVHLLYVQ
jgi:hypothetical protein